MHAGAENVKQAWRQLLVLFFTRAASYGKNKVCGRVCVYWECFSWWQVATTGLLLCAGLNRL